MKLLVVHFCLFLLRITWLDWRTWPLVRRSDIWTHAYKVTLAVLPSGDPFNIVRILCVTYVVTPPPTKDHRTKLYGRVSSHVGFVEYVPFICCSSLLYLSLPSWVSFLRFFVVSLADKTYEEILFPPLMTCLTQAYNFVLYPHVVWRVGIFYRLAG